MELRTFDPEEAAVVPADLSREDCVAALLMTLPEVVAERVLSKISPPQSVRLRERMRGFAEVPPPPASMGSTDGGTGRTHECRPAWHLE